MRDLDALARDVGTSGRTLRRAAARGTIRSSRPSPRRILVPAGERLYVRRHWPLLGTVLQELRTQPNVRLAVLFGSMARGEEDPSSDLDLLIHLRRDDASVRSEIAEGLERSCGRRVQLVALHEAERAPLLLVDVLRDGRAIVDRDGGWPRLRRRLRAVESAAAEEERRLERDAWAALDSLGAR